MSLSTKLVGWLFVSAQIMMLGALVLWPWPRYWVNPTAVASGAQAAAVASLAVVAVAAIGLGSALTATPVPKAQAGLRTGGLYRFARHPIYIGVLLFMPDPMDPIDPMEPEPIEPMEWPPALRRPARTCSWMRP